MTLSEDRPSLVAAAPQSANHAEPALLRITRGSGPVLAVALHAGHELRPSLAEHIALSEDGRLREEDPFTAAMVPEGISLIEAVRSRFEVDLNRPRDRAVYQDSDDAWGLDLYRCALPREVEDRSRAVYDEFYEHAHRVLSEIEREHGRFVVLDLHSYNHRRGGASASAASVELNPEINLGTARFDRERWSDVVDGFLGCMTESGFDCRENVKFRGGYFSQWVSDNFPDTGIALAIEFKKTYMDEWTGLPDMAVIERIRGALSIAVSTIEATLAETAR